MECFLYIRGQEAEMQFDAGVFRSRIESAYGPPHLVAELLRVTYCTAACTQQAIRSGAFSPIRIAAKNIQNQDLK